MIDTLMANQNRLRAPQIWEQLNLEPQQYGVMTLHRPANVDEEHKLKALIDEIMTHSQNLPMIFPVHPRTAKILEHLGISRHRLHTIEPLGYLEFIYLVKHAKVIITDSGGITEEASVMNVPCMTLRDNTERPETLTLGSNVLVGTNPKNIKPHLDTLFNGQWKQAQPIPLWDGKTASRIVELLLKILS